MCDQSSSDVKAAGMRSTCFTSCASNNAEIVELTVEVNYFVDDIVIYLYDFKKRTIMSVNTVKNTLKCEICSKGLDKIIQSFPPFMGEYRKNEMNGLGNHSSPTVDDV